MVAATLVGPGRRRSAGVLGIIGRFRSLGTILAVAAIALMSAACVGSSEGFETDISIVLESDPTIVDRTSTSATLLAITKVDLVCAIAYGLTEEYGLLTTDDDMASGGHSDHHPRLVGLQPDTLYHYRLGGIGPDGTVYRSRDFTFRTPAADPGAFLPSGDNLAAMDAGARVTGVSSNFGGTDIDGTWGANNAIDGDPKTAWSTDGDGNGAWIEIQLAQETRVTAIGFWTRTMGTSAEVSRLTVTADAGATAGPFELDGPNAPGYFPVEIVGTTLRFDVAESSGGNTGAVEIEVYGEPAN